MPGHHPVSSAVPSLLLKPRHERERLVSELCDRLSEGLDSDVAVLRELIADRYSRRRWGSPGTRPEHLAH